MVATVGTNLAISNLALRKLKSRMVLTALPGTTPEGIALDEAFDMARDAVLEAVWWPFAKKRAALTETTVPIPGSDWAISAVTKHVHPLNKGNSGQLVLAYDAEAALEDLAGDYFAFVVSGIDAGASNWDLDDFVWPEAATDTGTAAMVWKDGVLLGSTGAVTSMLTSLTAKSWVVKLGARFITYAADPTSAYSSFNVTPSGDFEIGDSYEWSIAAATTSEDDEYEHAFLLPGDCVAPRYLWAGARNPRADQRIPFALEHCAQLGATVLRTDEDAPVLYYTAQIIDPALYPPAFVDALAWKLAAECALPITGEPETAQFCQAMFDKVCAEARAAEFRSETEDQMPDSGAIASRG